MTSTAHTVSAVMVKSVRYDPVKDFAPVSWSPIPPLSSSRAKDFPANDIKGLIALAKKQPGKLNFATSASARPRTSAGELLRQMAGIDVKHIPYRTTPRW